ncbi:MAG: gamma-glutamyltransferase [Candidatus Competibacteraceae bacterium]|nr:gamma-glutamyltransferase [Candidatus Competibacteraceae bacterium]MCP5126183.1 gamma-glutamyltransferase [Gammaproteobacteria bacterium]HRX71187.1 gamma-glutamyltransferase [Candidatus Competibacteraceae bacterium]
MFRFFPYVFSFLFLVGWCCLPLPQPIQPAFAEPAAIYSARDRIHPVFARHGLVVSQEALASEVGLTILKQGGNAVDAAVAVGFALAVTLPQAGNLGGGGFMVVYNAVRRDSEALDFRETAPAAASRDHYLNEQGAVDEQRIRFSHQAAGVPGTVAGLALAHERHGRLPWRRLLEPAIRLAEQGFPINAELSQSLQEARPRMERWPASLKVFFKADGAAYQPGERLTQKDLARSLRRIAVQGPKAFYEGEIARKLVTDMAAHDGLITLDDLKNYRAVVREPVRGRYRDYEIVSMPPPSSGGVHLIQILNMLETWPLAELGSNSAATIHRLAEAMKLAYADRSEYLGDPDFVKAPVAGLTAKAYAQELVKQIDLKKARPSTEIKPGQPQRYESEQTTHYSVVDRQGNAVTVTYTLNFGYGSGIVAAGTGILLNNEMDDFAAKPGVPNAYGLIGGDANAVGPGKRPLSSMTPTLVFKNGQPVLITGSPGGSRIITTVLQIVLNMIDHQMNIAEATIAPRVHHQWLPDELRVEEGLSPDTVRLLEEMGHRVVVKDAMGSTQSIVRGPDGWYGFSDTRRPGGLAAGY